ncbi:glycoside hydrolase family 2 protein [Thermothelomyces heterothallicus CBS 202.75]|uniref:glycoside hydrolase family 2 protein n=1 Tax=Thermothelomyces heterothallicus CBS 202.75 TaxID=1149848 RepID=UPI003743299F
MYLLLRLALVSLGLLLACAEAAEPYRLRAPPLDTPWTKDVGTNPWPQHPRPQLRRDAWKTLNGIWTYQPTQGAPDAGALPKLPLEKEVLIPSCIESGISGIMDMSFQVTKMWFGTNFTVPPRWTESGRRVLLNFEAVDYEATVYVNGAEVGFNRGGYARFTFDITDHLAAENGANELHVFVFDPTDDQSIPQGKQTKRPSHIFYTPCTGIWGTVWLESVPDNFISALDLAGDMDGKLTVTVHSRTKKETPVEISVVAPHGGVAAKHKGVSDREFTLRVPDPDLWSPDSPTLYNVTVKLGADEVTSYTGFRTISSGVVNGIKRPLLNGEFVFLFGPLDQGYWPDGIYTPPTLEAMVYDLRVIKSLGMNMLRKHIKIEPDLFYEACDRLGVMVFQDMPSMRVFTNARPTDAEQKEFERQLEIMVNEHKSHPSIIAWVLYNEGWGQRTDYFPEFALTDRVRELDPTRLIDSVTGWHDHGAGDFSDNHKYAEPQCGTPWHSQPSSPFDPNRIGFQGEFGGIGHRPADENLWPIDGAVRTINETYEIHAGLESYHYRAHVLLTQLREQVERYACSGAVYTQTTDVEGEVNGLLTMDRRVVRVDVDRWREDIRALYKAARARAK